MNKRRTKSRVAPGGRRERHRRQEGVALLMIMIIIVITTAAAAASVRNTTAEMQAAGKERLLLQSRYASEAALMTTITYIDKRVQEGGGAKFLEDWEGWIDTYAPPETRAYTGGHQIMDANRYMAVRMSQAQMADWDGGPLVHPVSGPDPAAAIPDLTGSFGPSQPSVMEPFDADITDCSTATGTQSPGGQVNKSGGGTEERFDCTVTLRGRILMVNALGDPVGVPMSWLNLGGLDELQDRSGPGYDMRATFKTPPIWVPFAGN